MSLRNDHHPRMVISENLRIAPPVPTPKKGYYPTETNEINTYLDQDCQKEVNSLEVRPILGEVARRRQHDQFDLMIEECKNKGIPVSNAWLALAVAQKVFENEVQDVHLTSVESIAQVITQLVNLEIPVRKAIAAIIACHEEMGVISANEAFQYATHMN